MLALGVFVATSFLASNRSTLSDAGRGRRDVQVACVHGPCSNRIVYITGDALVHINVQQSLPINSYSPPPPPPRGLAKIEIGCRSQYLTNVLCERSWKYCHNKLKVQDIYGIFTTL